MSTEMVITGIVSLVGGVLAKIVFDWLKHGRNGKKRGNPHNGNIGATLQAMLVELQLIKECSVWSKNIHDNLDPDTGQPRWYVTSLVKEVRDVRKDILESVHLERKNREMLLRIWARITGGTDPGGTA